MASEPVAHQPQPEAPKRRKGKVQKTSIEWVKNPDGSQGYTFNPITGCLNHVNGLCKGGGFPCYAYRLAHGRLKSLYLANVMTGSFKPHGGEDDPFYPRFWPERLDEFSIVYGQNTARTTPKGIFVCDMGELFGDWVPREWVEQIFERIRGYPLHRFYLLTKQPQNLIKYSPFPDNCWVGVTATNLAALRSALVGLAVIKAKVKYLSFEPLLEGIDIHSPYNIEYSDIQWLIVGAQTKPYKPPEIEWVQEIVEAADKAGIPVFQKNNLWGDPKQEKFRLRQEMPQ